MHTLLVPVDFSQASKDGFEYALALANKFHARLTLLHVYPLSLNETQGPEGFDYAYLEARLKQVEMELENWVDQVPSTILKNIFACGGL